MTERLRQAELRTRPGAAVKVMSLCKNPDTQPAEVAAVIGTDALFTARVLRLANSAYYGLSRRVATLDFAVSVIGFQELNSLAALSAAGLDDPEAAPRGFWEATALTAVGSQLVAGMIGASTSDAYVVGLLHMIGTAMMHQNGLSVQLCVPEIDEIESAEVAVHGVSHAECGAQMLAAWNFPAPVCQAIGRHHAPMTPSAGALERSLHIGRSLAASCLIDGFGRRAGVVEPAAAGQAGERTETRRDIDEISYAWLSEGLITSEATDDLRTRVTAGAELLIGVLRPSAN